MIFADRKKHNNIWRKIMPNEEIQLESIPHGKLGIVSLESSQKLGNKVNEYLVKWRSNRQQLHPNDIAFKGYQRDTYLIDHSLPRFGNGEAKGTIRESVRGDDLYILLDITNHSLTYKMCGQINHMSPDDHYQDLKRIIAAASGKAKRINVIMPFLYESRQHRRSSRESLDCALALQELVSMGVENIITFDAHDPRVQNSIPLHGFESVTAAYQFVKALCLNVEDLVFDNNHMMVISPDEGGTDRAVYLANVLGINMGMFYKRRDYSRIVDGRNPIVAHEFLGQSVEGKDVFIIDDMISSGESMIDVATELKKRTAKRIFVISTFGLSTNGFEKFDEAVEKGIIYKVLTTDLIYQPQELLDRDYYISCGMSKYIAYIIDTLNHDTSISDLLNPYDKIKNIVAKYTDGTL